MATVSVNTYVYGYQTAACWKFFVEQLPDVSKLFPIPENEIPPNTKQFKAPFHNITSSDAHQLTAVLVDIVNDRDQFKANKMFYQQLHNSQENKPDDEV